MYERKRRSIEVDARSRLSKIDDSADPECNGADERAFFECVREERWPHAFELLCDQHCDFMLSVARRYEVAGGVITACDIVQEYLLSLFRGFVEDRFTVPSHHLRCYLAMGLHRVGISCRRREIARPAMASLDDEGSGDGRDRVDPLSLEPIGPGERVVILAKALAALPPKDLEVFHLRCVERLDHAGIAARLAIPVDSVRTRLHRAKKSLRTKLKEFHHGRHREREPTRLRK